MVVPNINALPVAPTRADAQPDYSAKADTFTAALPQFSVQVNTAVLWMADAMAAGLGYKNAAVDSAAASATSAAASSAQVALAAAQVALATAQAGSASTSAASAQTYAAAAQAAIGAPTLAGNKNKVLTVKADESGVLWRAVGQQIGDLMFSLNPPSAEYKLADGSTYLQASYPEYIAKVGLITPSPPTTFDGILSSVAPSSGSNKTALVVDSAGVYSVLVSAETTNNYIRIEPYKRVAGVTTKLTQINTTDACGGVCAAALSADGVYLVLTTPSSFLYVYKRTGDTFAKIFTGPTGSGGYGCAISDDGVYIGTALSSNPYFAAYKRSGDTFTKLATPVVGANAINSMNVSADGVYWAGHTNTSNPNIVGLKRVGDTFTVVPQVVVISANFASLTMSKDGNYLVGTYANSPNPLMYKRNGDTFTYLKQLPATSSGTNIYTTLFSLDSKYLFCAGAGAVEVFRNVNDTFTQIPLSGGNTTGNTLIAGHFDAGYSASFLMVYENGALAQFKDTYPFNPLTEFQVPNAVASNGTPSAINTSTNTLYPAVKAYVKMKEPA